MRSYVSKLVDGGRRVIALGHSYGGQVMTNALHGLGLDARKEKGLVGGVTDLIYLCAFALEEGGSSEYTVTSLLPLLSLTLTPLDSVRQGQGNGARRVDASRV
jgi:pimeloyl-ACP methyl ester carboxylesterase